LALGFVALFNVLSGFALSHARLVEVVRRALDQNALPYAARTNEDFFTECSLLEMQALRPASVLFNAVATRFLVAGGHPCESLQTLVLGAPAEQDALPKPYFYSNYAFGSRYLEAFALSVMDYRSAAYLYCLLSYGSIVLLLLAMLWSAPWIAAILSPIPVYLLLIGSFHLFGQNLGHAPVYFIGFLPLSGLISAKSIFRGLQARFCFFGVLGVVTAYFDLLNGGIPTILGLSVVLNHFFFVDSAQPPGRYAASALTQGLAIAVCFAFGFIALSALRLGILSFAGVALGSYRSQLAFLLGASDHAANITVGEVARHLWSARYQLAAGGAKPATWLLFLAVVSWMFALISAPLALRRGTEVATKLATDLFVLAIVVAGILLWYRLLLGHTYQHALFMVRMIALPAGCGVAAGLLTIRAVVQTGVGRILSPVTAIASVILCSLLTAAKWNDDLGATIEAAKSVEAAVDVVSCAPLGLHSDGQFDGVVELRYRDRRSRSPAVLLGLTKDRATRAYIRLERAHPSGSYETGSVVYILGIADTPGGALLNRSDGSYLEQQYGERSLYVHFCRDGADTPESIYKISVDGSSATISNQ
jgi:hypothetical protein